MVEVVIHRIFSGTISSFPFSRWHCLLVLFLAFWGRGKGSGTCVCLSVCVYVRVPACACMCVCVVYACVCVPVEEKLYIHVVESV